MLPDIYSDTGWWRTADLWELAVYALVAYLRAGAERRNSSVQQLTVELADRLRISVTL